MAASFWLGNAQFFAEKRRATGCPGLAIPKGSSASRIGFVRLARALAARTIGCALLLGVCSGGALAVSNPVPYVDIVSPVSIHPGATLVTLQVYGTGFVATSIVKWNGTSLTTTFVSSKKLTAAVPDSLVAAIGVGSITVATPGGLISNITFVPVAALETSTVFPNTASSTVNTGSVPQGIAIADFNASPPASTPVPAPR